MSDIVEQVVRVLKIFNPFADSGKPNTNSPSQLSATVKETVRQTLNELGVRNMAANQFVRLAGASGALAVILGAYGAHGLKEKSREDKLIFETGNRYHLLHSIALLASPFSSRPQLTGALFASGMLLFCGSCYYTGLTGNSNIRWITPYGGIVLIFAWASFIL